MGCVGRSLRRALPLRSPAALTPFLRDGHVEQRPVVEALEDGNQPDLPYDDLVTVTLARDHAEIAELLADVDPDLDVDDELDVPTLYASAEQLRTVTARIASPIDEGGGRIIAEAGRAFARRFDEAYPPARRIGRDPTGAYEQPLYWPGDMLELLQRRAHDLDLSLSYLVQYCFKLASAKLTDRDGCAAALAASGLASGDKRKQTLRFSGAILDDIDAHAARLDSSCSFVVQACVAFAKRELKTL